MQIQGLLAGGSAHLSGKLAVGDYIDAIDDEACSDAEHAAELLRGADGTLVTLLVRHGGFDVGRPDRIKLIRHPAPGRDDPGETVGVSAVLRVVPGGVKIDQVVPGGAVWLHGRLSEGSALITAIDGANVVGGHFTSEEVAAMFRGPPGTRVSLEVVMSAGERPAHEELVRMPPADPAHVTQYRSLLYSAMARGGVAPRGAPEPPRNDTFSPARKLSASVRSAGSLRSQGSRTKGLGSQEQHMGGASGGASGSGSLGWERHELQRLMDAFERWAPARPRPLSPAHGLVRPDTPRGLRGANVRHPGKGNALSRIRCTPVQASSAGAGEEESAPERLARCPARASKPRHPLCFLLRCVRVLCTSSAWRQLAVSGARGELITCSRVAQTKSRLWSQRSGLERCPGTVYVLVLRGRLARLAWNKRERERIARRGDNEIRATQGEEIFTTATTHAVPLAHPPALSCVADEIDLGGHEPRLKERLGIGVDPLLRRECPRSDKCRAPLAKLTRAHALRCMPLLSWKDCKGQSAAFCARGAGTGTVIG